MKKLEKWFGSIEESPISTIRELGLFQRRIKKEIEHRAVALRLSSDDIEPITDGVYSASKYLSSDPKIMWVLKEPYDNIINDKPYGGGWNIAEECFAKDDAWSNTTFQPIIYSMYGYYNNLYWDDMDWIRDDKSMADVLQQIAYINVGKMPAMSSSSDAHISECYGVWRDILLRQINGYNPDVIIFANTIQYFKDDLPLVEVEKNSDIAVYRAAGCFSRICLKVKHPNQKQITRAAYVDEIIRMIQTYVPKK